MTGARQVTIATPPGPYSEHAVAAVVADRDARIRELEAEVTTLSRRFLAARDLEGDMRREIIDAYEQGRITTLDVLRLPHTQPEAELAKQRETAYALGQRDAWMAVARAVGLEVSDCLSEGEIRAELARLRGATAR